MPNLKVFNYNYWSLSEQESEILTKNLHLIRPINQERLGIGSANGYGQNELKNGIWEIKAKQLKMFRD